MTHSRWAILSIVAVLTVACNRSRTAPSPPQPVVVIESPVGGTVGLTVTFRLATRESRSRGGLSVRSAR